MKMRQMWGWCLPYVDNQHAIGSCLRVRLISLILHYSMCLDVQLFTIHPIMRLFVFVASLIVYVRLSDRPYSTFSCFHY